MKCKMLTNWKHGNLYLEGEVYEFVGGLNDPSNQVIDEAIDNGYMEVANSNGQTIAEPKVVPQLFGGEAPVVSTPAPKGKQPKEG